MKHQISRQRGQQPRQAALSRLAEDITSQVIAALREGVRPWQQPWDSGAVAPGQDGRPLRHTGQAYAGINVLLLWLAAQKRGYLATVWMTYRQAQAYGVQVRRGEQGTVVVYADRFVKTVTDEENGTETEQLIPFLKTYTVFNAEQIDGLPKHFFPLPPLPLTPEQEAGRMAAVETFFAHSGAVIRHHGDVPCYIPAHDEIRLPVPGAFPQMQQYYATLAHELVHWTRHPSRLNRDLGRKEWGDAGYALEELVAELGRRCSAPPWDLPRKSARTMPPTSATGSGYWQKTTRHCLPPPRMRRGQCGICRNGQGGVRRSTKPGTRRGPNPPAPGRAVPATKRLLAHCAFQFSPPLFHGSVPTPATRRLSGGFPVSIHQLLGA